MKLPVAMDAHKTLLSFLLILVVAAFLRLYKLGQLPVGLTWDEAAIGYNGYGIATVHRDEWLNKMPVSFKSFGDYKAAAAIYLDAVSTKVVGLTPFGIRLPMALAGIATTMAAFWIGKAIFEKEELGLLTMLLVAISPLNVHFSRIAFESGIAVAFVAIGMAAILYASKRPWLYIIGALSLSLSLYAYHSSKIAIPLFLLVLAWVMVKELKKRLLFVGIAVVVFILTLIPLARDSLYGHAADRFFMTSQITNGKQLKPLNEVATIIGQNYFSHFRLNFLLGGASSTLRHGNGVFGILSYVELGLMLIAVFSLFRQGKLKKHWWILAFILIAILPAAIGDDAPHSNRAHLIVPWIQVLAVFGFEFLLTHLPKKKQLYAWVVLLVVLAVELCWQVSAYQRVYASTAATEFQYGYQEAVTYTRSQEGSVHGVLFTNGYGQAYIYILLFKKLTPIEY
ncbi:MAG TPA: phospholipid carrier-dependent glycosyltransferase, partial [Candidatus Saccharimonadia bacterium]|nr:phospholipid carrier-dependent glycosyltransferase [Candidatus Saccharimonadia bacterium]